MNREFLADALDFWKGALLERLGQHNVLHDLRVDGMFTDPPWDAPSLILYSNLVGIPGPALVQHHHTLANREAYFAGSSGIVVEPG